MEKPTTEFPPETSSSRHRCLRALAMKFSESLDQGCCCCCCCGCCCGRPKFKLKVIRLSLPRWLTKESLLTKRKLFSGAGCMRWEFEFLTSAIFLWPGTLSWSVLIYIYIYINHQNCYTSRDVFVVIKQTYSKLRSTSSCFFKVDLAPKIGWKNEGQLRWITWQWVGIYELRHSIL